MPPIKPKKVVITEEEGHDSDGCYTFTVEVMIDTSVDEMESFRTYGWGEDCHIFNSNTVKNGYDYVDIYHNGDLSFEGRPKRFIKNVGAVEDKTSECTVYYSFVISFKKDINGHYSRSLFGNDSIKINEKPISFVVVYYYLGEEIIREEKTVSFPKSVPSDTSVISIRVPLSSNAIRSLKKAIKTYGKVID